MGISNVPAAATSAEPRPKVIMVIRLELTPIRSAASLSCAVARIDHPTSVLSRNQNMNRVKSMAIKNAITSAMLNEISPRKNVALE